MLHKTKLYPIAKYLEALLVRLKTHILYSLFPQSRILMYHRVADVSQDPQLLAVSPQNFRAQIGYINEKYHIVPLSEIFEEIQKGIVSKNKIAITFDDGYKDNLYNALPILEEFNAPATIFVTTGNIGSEELFPWDRGLPEGDRGYTMTEEEIKDLSQHSLIEIGAHTVTHPSLTSISLENQKKEIKDSKERLESITGKTIRYFAYPFGSKVDFSEETEHITKTVGFEGACANIPLRLNSNTSIYTLPRWIVRNWSPNELKYRLCL